MGNFTMNRKIAQLLQKKESYEPHEVAKLFEKVWAETKEEMQKSLPDRSSAEESLVKQINDENFHNIGE